MDSITSIKLLISGVIIGIVLFQTSLSAPIIFKFLKPDQSKIYIRKIFPKIFTLMFLLGVGFLSLHFLADNQPITSLIAASVTVCFSLVCYLMIPATNKARDEGNDKKFKILHRLSVLLTMIVFFMNIIWVFI